MIGLTNGQGIMFSNVEVPRRHKVTDYLAWVLVLCLCIVKHSAALPLEDFYDFDTNGLDNKTAYMDDGGSDLIVLDVEFPFFNYSYTTLYVNNNGIISFAEKLQTYKPLNFNQTEFKDKIPLVAIYWADVDIENINTGGFNESVFYRITNNSALLNQCSQEIRKYFTGLQFSAKVAIIVTWYNVGFYGAAGDGKLKRNTFQALLVTSGSQSFAIFNYNWTTWTTGSNSGGDTDTGLGGEGPAVVGFSAGDLEQYYLLKDSGTDAIINVSHRSNIGIAGKYIFRLDGTVDDLTCFRTEDIEIFPTFVSMLGQEAVRVTGPCLTPSSVLKARIKELGLEFNCYVIQDQSAVCVLPTLFRTGELTFELETNDGWVYSTKITITHISSIPAMLIRQKIDRWQLGKKVTVTWDDKSAPTHRDKTLEVLAYTADDGVAQFHIMQSFSGIMYDNKRQFKLLSNIYGFSNTLVLRLCWTDEILRDVLPVCIWSDVFPVLWLNSNSMDSERWCELWLQKEQTMPRINIHPPNCPCLASMAGNDLGHFQRDPLCDIHKASVHTNCVYNTNATKCYRRNLKRSNTKNCYSYSADDNDSGQTCCYKADGNLMDVRDNFGSGTHQRYHLKAQGDTVVPFFSYFESDLLPRLHCCQYSDKNCTDFIKYRPATTCQNYKPPSPAQVAGDPHLVTLDGKNYSFNGVGDFFLVTDENSTIVIQVRAEQAKDKNGDLQNATVFSNIAVKMPRYCDTVEIRKTEEGTEVLVNKFPFATTKSTTSQLRDISLLHNDDGSFLIVLEPISVSVTVEVTPDLLNIIVLIGDDSLRGKLHGLLGNYNGDPSDDFISRNGETISSSSSERDIHFKFGMTWQVPIHESIMSTKPIELTDTLLFQPLFIDEQPDIDRNGTYELCGTNEQCIFDYRVTGKESVAQSTAQFTNKFKALKEVLEQKVVRCPYVDKPENGNKTQDGNSEGSTVNFTCNARYIMLHGTPTRACQVNSTWSGSDVMCALKTTDGSDGNVSIQLIVIIGVTSGVGVVILVVTVSVIALFLRRGRRKPPEEIAIPLPEMRSAIPLPEMHFDIPFDRAAYIKMLKDTIGDEPYRLPRINFVDPSIFQEYF